MIAKRFISLAAILGFLTVALGAFGAHVLQPVLAPERLGLWAKAVDYQTIHTLALLGTGLLARMTGDGSRALRIAGIAFASGVLLFSGSLYLLALTGIKPLGVITPIGGVAFLIGWAALFMAARRMAP